ncbi:MAG: XkdF-like putative serine protease domain-containing protein [Bacillota bacterium]
MKLIKTDADRNLVFGWASVAIRKDGDPVVDMQQEIVDVSALEDAAYAFVLKFRKTGVEHAGEAVGELVESFMVTPEKLAKMGLPANALPTGWWVGFHVSDDAVFSQVKSGAYSMFSIQGQAKRKEVL